MIEKPLLTVTISDMPIVAMTAEYRILSKKTNCYMFMTNSLRLKNTRAILASILS